MDRLIADSYELTENSVNFATEDKELEFVYNEAERLLKENESSLIHLQGKPVKIHQTEMDLWFLHFLNI